MKCLWCFLFGHKWQRKLHKDTTETVKTGIHFYEILEQLACSRCGEPNPNNPNAISEKNNS